MTIICPEGTQALSLRINSPMEQNVVPVTVKSCSKQKRRLQTNLQRKSKKSTKMGKFN
jgi:hypothetical protein